MEAVAVLFGRDAKPATEHPAQGLVGPESASASDDGKAFDVERVMRVKGGKHLGLIDMRERAEMLGGTFKVESKPGEGTTLHTQIPLHRQQRS